MKRCLIPCGVVLLLGGLGHADNWPQWRGPNDDGICKEKNVPTRWSETENIAWTLPMPGMGNSTPAVWRDNIFLTSQDGSDLVLMCVSTTGKERWRRKVAEGTKRYQRDEGNLASASPSTDGKHVYAYFGTGDLACFDFDGNPVWKFNVQDRFGQFKIWWGMHTSPLLYGDRLYLALIHSNGAHVVALDKTTGKTVWDVARKTDAENECEQAYTSPVVWHRGKEAYLITHGGDYAIAHRLSDGKEIWRLGGLNPKDRYNGFLRFVASPVAGPDLIVVPTAKNGPVVGVKPDARGDVGPGSAYEQWRLPHGTPDVPSPLVEGGLVYLCSENGFLTCLDAATGKQHYRERLSPARYRASPVYADGKVYLTARDGRVTVVKAGPRFEVVAVNRLSDDVGASPAISNGRIYLRGWKTLYAIGSGSARR